MDHYTPEPCPFCGFKAEGDYQIMLHMETLHAEGDSPFAVRDNPSTAALMALHGDDSLEYVNCTIEGCGEAILFTELDNHIDMHSAELEDGGDHLLTTNSGRSSLKRRREVDSFDIALPAQLMDLPHPNQSCPGSTERQSAAKAVWKGLLKMPEPSSKAVVSATADSGKRRLGKAELGPHANEKRMPHWLVNLLQQDGATKTERRVNSAGQLEIVQLPTNHVPGIVPLVDQLLALDPSTSYAYLCDPNVRHISKIWREGGFCGYRNIQMMCSYIIGVQSQGYEHFKSKIPTIFDIQEYIEHAWDLGINSVGRVETGGIRGTRKYIGTPDAQAMFCSLNISCDAQAIRSKPSTQESYQILFQLVEDYFSSAYKGNNHKIRATCLPPIYLQHPGHSMTIIGIEKKFDGSNNLIVFDPMFHDSSSMLKMVGQTVRSRRAPGDRLKAYRRGSRHLRRYKEFEILKLTPPAV